MEDTVHILLLQSEDNVSDDTSNHYVLLTVSGSGWCDTKGNPFLEETVLWIKKYTGQND